uniref:Zinc knuckle domain containing protein n=1 Tax=Oryza sativa subsp. japonica TaxID=39947 RepID=Q6AV62_ORYSJ|nr:zinc knuckle domain containing protein [Oryza sativa Japonica Group]
MEGIKLKFQGYRRDQLTTEESLRQKPTYRGSQLTAQASLQEKPAYGVSRLTTQARRSKAYDGRCRCLKHRHGNLDGSAAVATKYRRQTNLLHDPEVSFWMSFVLWTSPIWALDATKNMSDITKKEFAELALDGSNYLTWALDVEIKLDSIGLDHTIVLPELGTVESTKAEKAKALHFLRHHLHPDLKSEYMTEKNPLVLWQSLKDRFDQQGSIVLPQVQHDWITLHFQDYKSTAAYNSAPHRIISQLRFCGQKITDAEMIEKTLSTFHPNNIVLQQQYRNSKYPKYSDLISVLLVAERQNEVLLKNHSARPTGSMAVPEAHANVVGNSRGRKRGHGEKKGKGKGSIKFKGKSKGKPRGKGELKKVTGESSGEKQDNCYRCGGRGHWSRNCHVPKHLVELYQQSMNEKKSQHESHFTIEPEAQIEKHDDMLINVKDGGDVRMDDDWNNLLEKDDNIFGDLKPYGNPMAEEDICLVDNATTNTILRETMYFHTLTKKTRNIMTIAGSNAHIVGTGSATLVLPMGTHIFVKDALLDPDSKRTLLSFKDIRANGFHIETEIEQDAEYLLIRKIDGYQKQVVERLPSLPSGLYYTYIKPTEEYVAMKTIFRNPESFRVWYDRLGHPGLGMMRRIISNSAGHNVETNDFPNPEDFICPACAKGKLIIRPSLLKIRDESPVFLVRIQGDICGPIQPLSGPVRTIFPALGGERHPEECRDIIWNATGMQSLDPRTSEAELEVQRIINLQNIVNKLPDAFTDYKGVTRSHIPTVNAPERVEVTQKVTDSALTPHPRKMGRPPVEEAQPEVEKAPEEATQPEVEMVPEGHHPKDGEPSALRAYLGSGRSEHSNSVVMGNHDELEEINEEISTNCSDTGELHHRKTTIVDIHFASKIVVIMDPDPEPKSMIECQKRSDWDKWKAAIEAKMRSLYKREVFGPAVPTPPRIIPVGCKWVFLRKRNGQVVRYKARLVAQWSMQRPGIDYDETYSPVMSGITFRYLISMATNMNLDMQLMDVVTAYLYGSLDSEIYMRVPEGLKIPNPKGNRNMYSVRLQRSLYGLKQSGRMWFNRLSNYLLKRADKDPFKPKKDDEEMLGPEVPYLSAIGALMYLAYCTRPDIAFALNLLARYSATPTRRHWVGVKTILRYLRGTQDLGLWFPKNQDPSMVGYVDAGYMSDPHNAISQTGFIFLCGNTAISWRSVKQTLVATSTNHSEIIALYEATRECVWLRRMIGHIQKSCGLNIDNTPTIIYEDNAACVAQIHMGYVKSNFTKHIVPKFFYPHELQKSGEINVLQTKSCENLADLFTKSLPASSFHRCVRGIGMRRLSELQGSGGAKNSP